MNKNKWARVSATLAVASLTLTLTACTHEASSPSISPVATTGASTSVSPSATEPSATPTAVGDLSLPAGVTLSAPAGPAVEKFGKDYSMRAFEFAAALAYRLNVWPGAWAEGPTPESLYTAMLPYFGGALVDDWKAGIPALRTGRASQFNKWFFVPIRNADGTLEATQEKVYDPWVVGVSFGPASTSVEDGGEFGEVLNIRFKMTLNMVSEAKDGQPTAYIPVVRDQSYMIAPNPDEAARATIPFVLIGNTCWDPVYGERVTIAGK